MYVCTHVCMYECMYVYMNACMYVYMCVYDTERTQTYATYSFWPYIGVSLASWTLPGLGKLWQGPDLVKAT